MAQEDLNYYLLTGLLIGSVVIGSVFPLLYNRAYSVYKITDQGVSNRYLTIKWEDIDTCSVYNIEVNIFSKTRKNEISKVVAFPGQSVGSFMKLNPKKCVYFSINSQNLELINKYYKGASEDIKCLLVRFQEMMTENKNT